MPKQEMLWKVVRKRTGEILHQCRTDGRRFTKKETQMTHGWTDAWARYLEHIAKIDISHIATAEQSGRYQYLLYLRAFGEDSNGPPSASRLGYQELKNVQKKVCKSSGEKMLSRIHPNKCQEAIDSSTSSWHKRVPSMAWVRIGLDTSKTTSKP